MTARERTRYSVENGIARITLDRPEKRNALDDRMIAELMSAVVQAGGDAAVRVLLLRGAGPAFCAGADLAQLERVAAGTDARENLEDARRFGELLVQMRRTEKPIVAAIHGPTLAGGAGLAGACDLVLARDDAELGYPEVRLGFVPAMVMALLRRAIGEKAAFELIARGDRIGAEEARRLGLVNRVFPAAEFDAAVDAYVAELAARPPSALGLIKRLFYGIEMAPFDEAIARGAEVNVLARATDECREGVRRFLAGEAD